MAKSPAPRAFKKPILIGGIVLCVFFLASIYVIGFTEFFAAGFDKADAKANAAAVATSSIQGTSTVTDLQSPNINPLTYQQKLIAVANIATSSSSSSPATSSSVPVTPAEIAKLWPVQTVTPDAGALLPYNRIVAYYGNFYSTHMGVLGEYPPQQMLSMLTAVASQWQAADPSTPVIPAIDYIAVTAQGSPGADGMYRLRMPDSQIQEAITLANQVHGIVILDIQVGLSNVQTEVPLLAPYLKLPNVELALDPEFSMKDGAKPGTEIGTMDATDINFAANYMAGLVRANNIPPKILVVHRFTQDMVTHYKNIQPLPEVEIVMDMDGWGSQAKKLNTYEQFIAGQPVQFTGFKLFYKNDLRPPSTGMLTPAQLLKLTPQPLFIQYQ